MESIKFIGTSIILRLPNDGLCVCIYLRIVTLPRKLFHHHRGTAITTLVIPHRILSFSLYTLRKRPCTSHADIGELKAKILYDIVDTFMKDETTAFDDIPVKTLVLGGLNRHKNGGCRGGVSCSCAQWSYIVTFVYRITGLDHRFFPLPCFFPVTWPSAVSRKPPNSRAFLAAWLICLNLSGPKWIPPQYRVTMTSTLLTS